VVQPQDEFETILATSQAKEKSLDDQADSVKVQAYDSFARKS
jgi:hypothetical protein